MPKDHKPVSGWICGGCEEFTSQLPWKCPGCNKPLCERCFDSFMHCTACYVSSGGTPAERDINCAKATDAMYGTDMLSGVREDLYASMLSDE